MPKIVDYFNSSIYISSRLNPSLRAFFDGVYQNQPIGMQIYAEMDSWRKEASKLENYEPDAHFLNYIWYILSTENEVSSKIPLRKYTESKRKRKNYFLETAKKEKNGGFEKGVIRDFTDSYFQLRTPNDDNFNRFSSKEDYMNYRYNQILSWGSSKTNELIAYPFIYQISEKRAAKCFYTDCAVNIYSLIDDNLGGNVLNGYVKTLPRDIGGPIFSLNPKEADVSFDVRANEINSYIERSFTSPDGTTESIKTHIGQYKGTGKEDEFIEYVNSSNEAMLIESLMRQGVLSPKANVLDSTDMVLFGHIYSLFSVEDINKGLKRISLLSLVKQMYGTSPRREYYENIFERLDKMAHCHVDTVTTNAQGKVVKAGTVSFFEVTYLIPQDETGEEDEELYTTYSVNSNSAHEHLRDILKECNELSGIDLEIAPSPYFKNKLRESMDYYILTELYNAEMPSRVKAMLIVLFKERSDIYPQTSCTFTYDFFIHNLGIEPMKKSALTKQIDNMLRYLKEHSYIVKDYKLTGYKVEIEFIPVNDEEKKYYKLETKSLIGEA